MTRPDQVWVADITYVRLLEEFVYLAVHMDVFIAASGAGTWAVASTKGLPRRP